MSFAYMASPYTHPLPETMERRYQDACAAFAWLLDKRIWTYSPIIHCHEVAKRHDLPRDADFWEDYNKAMLIEASTLFILAIEGYDTSKGVTAEREFAQRNKIPVRRITPHLYGFTMSRY